MDSSLLIRQALDGHLEFSILAVLDNAFRGFEFLEAWVGARNSKTGVVFTESWYRLETHTNLVSVRHVAAECLDTFFRTLVQLVESDPLSIILIYDISSAFMSDPSSMIRWIHLINSWSFRTKLVFFFTEGIVPPYLGSCIRETCRFKMLLETDPVEFPKSLDPEASITICLEITDNTGKTNAHTQTLVLSHRSLKLEPRRKDQNHRANESMRGLVPFNLSTTSTQKSERAKVELPFLKAQAAPEIIYRPDTDDDLDDEDPDADLEI